MTHLDDPPSELYMDDGAPIYVKIAGKNNGKPIVLVHGFGLDQRMWRFQTPYLTKKGYRVIRLDLRGFGNSWNPEQPHKTGDYTYDTWANDLATVLEKLNLQNLTLVGYSLGGAVAMRYMSQTRERVNKLVFISAAGPNMQEENISTAEHARLDATCWGFKEFADIIKDFENTGTDSMFRHLRRFIFPAIQGLDLIYKKKYLQWIEGMFERASPHALIGALDAMRGSDLTKEASSICTPTSIYHGLFDPFVPVTLGKHLHTLIEESTFTTLWGGHGIFYEQIDDINRGLIGRRTPACTLSWCPVREVMGRRSET